MVKYTCLTCVWYVSQAKEAVFGNCFLKPPTVQFIAIEVPPNAKAMLRGQTATMQMSPASARPLVQQDHFCESHATSP